MAKTRRSYKGGAASTTTGTSIAASGATTFTIAAYTGWPYGTPPFYVVVEPGTSNEEKILVTRAGATDTTVNIYATPSVAANRGMDGTTAFLHASGSTVYPVFTATDADEANELASTLTTQGDILIHGASTFGRVGIGTAAHVLKVNSGATAPEWGQVATAGIADDAVTAAKIAANAVGASEIATGAVGSDELASNSVITAKILDANVTTGKLADSAVTSAKIADDAITAAKIAANAVGASELADDAVDTAAIVNLAVTTAKIADLNVTTAKIADLNVTTGKLNDLSVTTGKLNDLSVTTGKLNDLSVTTGKLDALAVTDAKIANNTITTGKMATPYVQAGTGTGHLGNIVKIGWAGYFLSLEVDTNSFGPTWPINVTGNAATVTGSTSANTANAIVQRNGSGGFAAQTIDIADGAAFGSYSTLTSGGIVRTGVLTTANTPLTTNGPTNTYHATFHRSGTVIGSIYDNGSGVTYNTTSDYRLKENVIPLVDALEIIEMLTPKTYNFISNPTVTEHGFFAHELAEVIPYAVCGQKDAIDEEGNIKPQQVDYSKLVAVLVGAVQELSARITELENK